MDIAICKPMQSSQCPSQYCTALWFHGYSKDTSKMSDNPDQGTEPTSAPPPPPPRGALNWDGLINHVKEHKLDVALWFTRIITIFFTFTYFIPFFGNPYSAYYKALMSNAATSALRLHLRMPRVQLSQQFLAQLLLEDSCHYLFYSLIFLYVSPVTYPWTELLVGSKNAHLSGGVPILQYAAGRAGLLTPFIYYNFLSLRYSSRRNPYTRNMFRDMRVMVETTANKPGVPAFLRSWLTNAIALVCRLAPRQAPVQPTN
ncbi:hypothetical protein B566_EDAN001345 [Ephemera danica]|nr:hypothetical protein B566_EDAN001345 [Ephemera danica]